MDLSFQYLLDGSFHPSSRIWVYQCNRLFEPAEASAIRKALKEFTDSWKSHGEGTGAKIPGQFFDRTNLAFVMDNKVQTIPLNQLDDAIQNGTIKPETSYFNNVVLTKEELESKWILPLKNRWLNKKLSQSAS